MDAKGNDEESGVTHDPLWARALRNGRLTLSQDGTELKVPPPKVAASKRRATRKAQRASRKRNR